VGRITVKVENTFLIVILVMKKRRRQKPQRIKIKWNYVHGPSAEERWQKIFEILERPQDNSVDPT